MVAGLGEHGTGGLGGQCTRGSEGHSTRSVGYGIGGPKRAQARGVEGTVLGEGVKEGTALRGGELGSSIRGNCDPAPAAFLSH